MAILVIGLVGIAAHHLEGCGQACKVGVSGGGGEAGGVYL